MKRLSPFLVAVVFSAPACLWTSASWAASSKDSIWRIDGRLIFHEQGPAPVEEPRKIRIPGLFTPSSGFDISLASRPEDFNDVVRDLMPQRGTLLRVPLQNAKHKKNGTQADLEVYRSGVVVRLKARF